MLLVYRCFSGGGDGYRMSVIRRATKDTGEREKDNKKATRPRLGTALLRRPHIIGGSIYNCEEEEMNERWRGQEVDHRGVWSVAVQWSSNQ